MRRASVLSLCLLGILACATAKPQFVVLTPGLLKSGETGKACLIAQEHTEPIDVDIFVTVGNANIMVFQGQVQPGENSKCAEFQVPEQAQATPAIFNLKATSGSFNYNNSQKVVVAPSGNNVLITSDKYKYTAGQTAHFHIMEVNKNLRPVETTFPSVHVANENGNKLREWQYQRTTNGFLYVQFPILPDSDFGKHQLVVQAKDGQTFSKDIMVEDYEPVRFSVAVNTPSAVTIEDTAMNINIEAQYPQKQPVPGTFLCKLYRPLGYFFIDDPCSSNPDGLFHQVTGKLDSTGKYKGSIDLTRLELNRQGYSIWMRLDVTVTEQGSGDQITETKIFRINSTMRRTTFEDKLMSPYFKRNLSYHVVVKVEDGWGQPKVNETVELNVYSLFYKSLTLTSDKDGRAEFELDTSMFETTELLLKLENPPPCFDYMPSYSDDSVSITRFFSGSQSSVHLYGPQKDLECGATHNIRAQYVIDKESLEDNVKEVTFFYSIMARAKFVHFGEHRIESRRGEFTFSYMALPEHAPTIQVVIMTMVKDELVADTMELSLEKCFKNDVSVSFSAETGTPGSDVDLQIKATPASVCLGRMYDSSLQFLDQGDALTPAKVLNAIQYAALRGYDYDGYDVTPPQPPCVNADKSIVIDNLYYTPKSSQGEVDSAQLFQSMGLMALTPMPLQQSQLCGQEWVATFTRPMGPERYVYVNTDMSGGIEAEWEAKINTNPWNVRARERFPETQIFYPLFTDASGVATHSIKVPGTITTWKFDAVCLSNDTGIGMSKVPANFTSIKQMFVDLSFASSIVRGEKMSLVASATNFIKDKCAKIKVTLDPSNGYTAEAVDAEQVKCVCSGERATFTWNINDTSLGEHTINVTAQTVHIAKKCDGDPDANEPKQTDIITQNFKVEVEGVKKDATQSKFVCVKGDSLEVDININPSESIVPDSLTGEVQVMGEILGEAFVSPEAMFKTPTGSGQQNLAKLVSVISYMEYFNRTGRLTPEMKEKATQNIIIAYQRQMQLRNWDGSFSIFKGGEPNSWVTLESLKGLGRCKTHISVDQSIINQGAIYLASLQDPKTGSFKPQGAPFNQALRGKDLEVSFSTEVASFLVDNPLTLNPAIYKTAKSYLELISQKQDLSLYDKISSAYALKIMGSPKAGAAFQEVKNAAIEDGETIHFEPDVQPKSEPSFVFPPPSSSDAIEMTSIALTTVLHGQDPATISEGDLNYATKMAHWLALQQKKGGSYGNTLDTVKAVDALSNYARLIYNKEGTNTVELKKGNEVLRVFTVDASNRHIPQVEPLKPLPGQYKVVVSGNGCLFLQAGAAYSVPFKQEDPSFLLAVTTFSKDCQDGVAPRFTVQVKASYVGTAKKTNMVLIEAPLLSGQNIEYSSLGELRSQFPKIEVEKGRLVIYLNYMEKGKDVYFTFVMERSNPVSHFQPKTCIIYDSYSTGENGKAEIKHPCTLQAESQ